MRSFVRLALLAALAFVHGCEGPVESFDFERAPSPIFRRSGSLAATPSKPSSLRVMTWNVKFGAARIDFWFDYWGDRVQMSQSEVRANLGNIVALVRDVKPDVFFTNEIDVNSRRSAYVDMVQSILDGTEHLNYAAYFQTWASRYVPSEGLGRVDMGNAVFSRYRIVSADQTRLSQRTELSAATRDFYGQRMLGRVVLDLGGREVAAFVVHTEAYDRDGTKTRQLAQGEETVRREPRPFGLGGDFNELPPGAVRLTHFPDEHPKSLGTEFEQPPYTPEAMQPFFDRFVPAISLADFGTTEASQARYYSHSILGPERTNFRGERGFWNRTLDYLFASPGSAWTPGRSDVLQAPGRLGITADPNQLSDHAPVVGDWILPP